MKNKLLLLSMGFALISQTLMAQVPSYVPTNGLVGYWPFNGNANDESGNGNNGTVNGATLTTNKYGNVNSAYSFDGVNDNIGITNPFMNGTQVNSFSFYTRLKITGNPPSGSAYNIWGKSYSWGEINFGIDSNNTIYIIWANSNNGNTYTHIQTTNGINLNTWYDIIITFQNSEVKIYFNGVNQTTNDYYGTNSLANFAQDANSNNIGSRIFGGQTVQYFNGIIDDFGIWNRALTQQEITNLYNSSLPQTACLPANVPTTGLVGYWPFCGNANDESGNGNNGTVNGATLTTDRFGNSNSAYSFDGVNDNINLGANPNISLTSNNELSISLWFLETNNNSGALLSKYANGNPGQSSFYLGTSNGLLQIGGNGTQPFPTCDYANAWSNLILTCIGGNCTVFLNGIPNCNISFPVNSTLSSLKLFVGSSDCPPNDPNCNYFTGNIDDIGIWNRALTPQEITNLYNANQCITNITVTDTLIINVGQLSFNDPITWANNITIAPNPASTQININFNNITNLNGGTLKIINSLGQEVATTPITVSGTNTSMQLATWGGAGMYFVQIINPQGQIVDIKKIILQ